VEGNRRHEGAGRRAHAHGAKQVRSHLVLIERFRRLADQRVEEAEREIR